LAAFAAADQQVVAPVAVEVKPRDARTELAEAVGQERLAGEIVEGFFGVDMAELGADVSNQGRGGGGGGPADAGDAPRSSTSSRALGRTLRGMTLRRPLRHATSTVRRLVGVPAANTRSGSSLER